MPNKLTDSEIVKALELCLKNECDKCPFNLSEVCQIDLMKLLFDLFNRLQAENERKDKIFLELLKTSSERAEIIGKQSAEIESLTRQLHNAKLHQKDTYKSLQDEKALRLNEDFIKAEAYKEFADKFKKKLSRKYTTSLWKVYCEEIDNLLKELVGEDND